MRAEGGLPDSVACSGMGSNIWVAKPSRVCWPPPSGADVKASLAVLRLTRPSKEARKACVPPS